MGYSYKNMVSIYDSKGTVIKQFNNPVSNSYRGLNSLFTSNKVLVPTPDSLLIYENNKLSFVSTAISCTYKNWNDKVVTESRGVNSLIADKIFKYKNHENCVLLVSQGDRMVENKGFITIVSLDTKKVVARLQLPHTTEFAPVIEDVNLDGKLDVLINCRDGYLYCFDLNVAAANNQKLAATK